MVTAEEKLALAKELALYGVSENIRAGIDLKTEIGRLTALKFPITNERKILKKLPATYWGWEPGIVHRYAMGTIIGMVAMGMAIARLLMQEIPGDSFSWWIPGGIAILSISVFASSLFHFTEIRSEALEIWNGALPYGALLALKEAKQAGLAYFRIYFPARMDSSIKLSGDPVIVGQRTPSGPLLEIFAWDDRIIYE